MARPTLDLDGTSSFAFTFGGSITISHTVAGSNRVLLVSTESVTAVVTGVTWNGGSLTLLQNVDNGTSHCSLYYLTGAGTGTFNVVISMSGLGATGGYVSSWKDVDTANPFGTVATDTGSSDFGGKSVTTTIDTIVQDVIGGMSGQSGNATEGAGQTLLDSSGNGGNQSHLGVSYKNGAAGTTAMDWTNTAAYCWLGVAINGIGITGGVIDQQKRERRMKLIVKKGTTSKMVQVLILDSSSTTGAGLTGLTSGSSGLVGYYYREGAGSTVSISLTTMTLGTFTSAGFIVIDATNMPGMYQIGIPDTAFATGANSVTVMLKGAANMVPIVLEVQLVDFDPSDAVRLGLTALPNVAAGANGGLPTGDASARVTVGTIANNAITAAVIATDAIDADALASDAVTEIWAKAMTDIAAIPGITGTVLDAINYLFVLARNKRIQTSTTETLYKDNGSTSIGTSTKSDDGTTFTRGKYT